MGLNGDRKTAAEELPEIPIGQIIHDEVRRQGVSAAWLGSQMGCDRRNIYDIFNRTFIDTRLLMRLSAILGRDFFKVYSDFLNNKSSTCSKK